MYHFCNQNVPLLHLKTGFLGSFWDQTQQRSQWSGQVAIQKGSKIGSKIGSKSRYILEHQVKSPHLPQWSEQVDSKRCQKQVQKQVPNRAQKGFGGFKGSFASLNWTKPRLTYFKQAVLK